MIIRSLRIQAVLLAVVTLLISAHSFAFAKIKADMTFGSEGVVIKDFGFGNDEVFSLVVQDDGKILAAGYLDNGFVKNLAVTRYSPDGIPDTTYNDDGTYIGSFGSGNTIGNNLVYLSDGTILVAGVTEDIDNKAFIARLTPEGFLDTTFGENNDGMTLVVVDGDNVENTDVVFSSDGSIFLVNTFTDISGDNNSNILKFTPDGELDVTFGDQGVSELQITEAVHIKAISLLSDSKILAAGYDEESGGNSATLLRFNEDGTVDSTFGTNGILKLTVEGQSSLQDIVYVDDNNLYLIGFANKGTPGTFNNTFVVKMDENGSVDSGFGTGGIYKTGLNIENRAFSGSINGAGQLQVVGYSSIGIGKDVFVLTIQETGTAAPVVDYLTEDVSGQNDAAYSVASVSGGNFLVAGSTENGDNKDFLIMSLSSTGTNTSSAGSGGSQSAGVVAAGYKIYTKPITEVTRVGFMSGGTINQTIGTASEITLRGVVYGTKQFPEYETGDDVTTTDSTDDSTSDSTETSDGVFPADRDSNYIVQLGHTEDGSGIGTYESDVEDITPGTRYYLRAYAVLADDTIIYGNQVVVKTDDACFIATAAYGSILDKHVVILREFRDTFLAKNSLGQLVIGTYYKYSPWLAGIIEQHEMLAAVVRFALVPAIGVAFLTLKLPYVANVLILGAAIVFTVLLVGWFREFYKNPAIRREAGFTLIELLVVLVIIGILAGYIGPKIMGHPEEAKRVKAGLQIQGLETALKMYKLDNGMYPSTEQGLQALIEPPATGKLPPKWRDGGYLDKGRLPTDPWKNAFVYLSPGLNDDFDLTSYAADGELGGEGDAQDINSWEIE